MAEKKYSEKFLRVTGDFTLSKERLGNFVLGMINGKPAETFWDFNTSLLRKRKAKPSMPKALLPLGRADYEDFWHYDALRDAVACAEQGTLDLEKYEILLKFLNGENITITRNRIHIRTKDSFLALSEANLKEAFKALMGNWLEVPVLNYAKSECRVVPILDSVTVENVRKGKEPGCYAFSYYFDYKIQCLRPLNRKWNPEIYREPRDLYHADRPKFIWDLFHYADKMQFGEASYKYARLVFLKPTCWQDHVSLMGYFAIGEQGENFMETFRLLDEFLENGKNEEALNKLADFQKGHYLYGKECAALFSRKIKELSIFSMRSEISDVSRLLEGLSAAEKLIHKFAEVTGQSGVNTVALKKGMGKVIANKIMLDPALYANDARPYISNFARAVISGVISPDE